METGNHYSHRAKQTLVPMRGQVPIENFCVTEKNKVLKSRTCTARSDRRDRQQQKKVVWGCDLPKTFSVCVARTQTRINKVRFHEIESSLCMQ